MDVLRNCASNAESAYPTTVTLRPPRARSFGGFIAMVMLSDEGPRDRATGGTH
ncbi:MAG TPA: hypothetical protein VF178_05765 [Gemmatimonadaceae bacterium]